MRKRISSMKYLLMTKKLMTKDIENPDTPAMFKSARTNRQACRKLRLATLHPAKRLEKIIFYFSNDRLVKIDFIFFIWHKYKLLIYTVKLILTVRLRCRFISYARNGTSQMSQFRWPLTSYRSSRQQYIFIYSFFNVRILIK